MPLISSLNVPSTLDDANKVLVNVGTGNFIEKMKIKGKDYCERKINLLKSNYIELVEVASKKKAMADDVREMLHARLK